jgi:hypothetical protein
VVKYLACIQVYLVLLLTKALAIQLGCILVLLSPFKGSDSFNTEPFLQRVEDELENAILEVTTSV